MANTSVAQCKMLLARQQALHQQQQKRTSRRLHDDLSQQLTLLSLQLSIAQMDSNPPANWTTTCSRWSTLVMELGQNLRQIMNELQPRVTEESGLGEALNWFGNTACETLQCKVILPVQPVTLSLPAANEIYSVCRDIVNELFAAQGVTEAKIALEEKDEFVRVHISTTEKISTLAMAAPRKLEDLLANDRLFCLGGTVDVSPGNSDGVFAVSLAVPSHRVPVSHAA